MLEDEEKLKVTKKADETKIFNSSSKSKAYKVSASGTKYQGAISSIHFAKVTTHSFKHNSREEEKKADTIFEEYTEQNEYNLSANEAKEKFDNLYAETKKIRDKQKIRIATKNNCLWECVINLKSTHNLEDVKKAVKHYEKLTGFTAIQMAVHKDEGQEKNGKLERKNHHAHINFFTLDKKTGQQLYRREFMNRTKLKELQDITAKSLDMQRGQNNSPAKRLEHKAYKIMIREKETAHEANLALKQEFKQEVEELKAVKAPRQDYAKLEQVNKDLQELIKKQKLDKKQIAKVFKEKLKAERKENSKIQKDLKNKNSTLKAKNTYLKNDNKYQTEQKQKFQKEIYGNKGKFELGQIKVEVIKVKVNAFKTEEREIYNTQSVSSFINLYEEHTRKIEYKLKNRDNEIKSLEVDKDILKDKIKEIKKLVPSHILENLKKQKQVIKKYSNSNDYER